MGKGSKQTQTQQQQQTGQSSTELDPMVQRAAYENLAKARDASDMWSPTMQYGPAGFNGDQYAAMEATRQAGGAGQGQLNDAIYGTSGVAGYQPQQIGQNGGYQASGVNAAGVDRGQIRDVSGGSAAAGMSQYMNPYTTDVINAAQGDLERSRSLARQQDEAHAAAAGAFGGSRHAVLDSLTNDDYLRQASSLAANLRSQGFDTAAANSQQDYNRALSAQQSNQGVDANVASGNAGMQQQAHLANQDAQNQAAQFGATQNYNAQVANQQASLNAANLRLQGANQLGNLATQQQNNAYNNAGALMSQGAMEQALRQQQQDVDYENRQAIDNLGLTRLGINQSALGLTPYGTTTNSSGTGSGSGSSTTSMGLGSSIMQGLGTAAGIAGMGYGMFKSDRRLKENIRPMTNPLAKVRKMTGVDYRWKPGLNFPGGAQDAGLIAQDVEKAMPHAVSTIGGAKHYHAPAVLGLLTQAVKELDRRTARR